MSAKSIHFLLIFFLLSCFVQAQQAQNPFDIGAVNAEEEEVPVIEKEVTAVEKNTPEVSTRNPFDIVNSPSESVATPAAEVISPTISKAANDEILFKKYLLGIVLGMLVLLTILVTLFRSLFYKAYQAFINDNLLNQLYRDYGGSIVSPFTILHIFFFLCMGIFVYLIANHTNIFVANHPLMSLIYCVLAVMAVYVTKHLVLSILGFIFPIQKEMRLYRFMIVIFSIILALVLVPANVFIAYASPEVKTFVLYIMMGLFIIFFAYRSLKGVLIGNRFLAFYRFHFLLYICAIEIAPVFILLKLIQRYYLME